MAKVRLSVLKRTRQTRELLSPLPICSSFSLLFPVSLFPLPYVDRKRSQLSKSKLPAHIESVSTLIWTSHFGELLRNKHHCELPSCPQELLEQAELGRQSHSR